MGTETKRMSKEELENLISGIVKNNVESAIGDAVKPLQDKQTAWLEEIKSKLSRKPDPENDQGLGVARAVRMLAMSKGDVDKAVKYAKKAQEKVWRDDIGESVERALMAGELDSGGFMLQPEFVQGMIPFLYARSVVRRAGPQVLPMNSGSLVLPKHTGSVTASYVGESEVISKTEPTGGQIVMTAKKLAAIVPMSNDLLRYDAGNQADVWVRNDLVRRIAVREDKAFLRDDGTEHKPKGMRYWVASGNVTNSNGTSATNIEDDIKTLINSLESNNVELQDSAFFMAPRSKNHLVNLRDANGNLIYPTMREAQPTLFGRPVFVTTNIPTNLGGGTESEVYLVNMMDAIIGESGGLEIEVDRSASYTSGGSLVSAFERDETLMRVIERHDFAMGHEESVAVIDQITWGA